MAASCNRLWSNSGKSFYDTRFLVSLTQSLLLGPSTVEHVPAGVW